jgi:hypothetical protein
MAVNEVYRHGNWLSLPLPLRGDDPAVNADPTLVGDPVKIGSIVGVAQEVGGPISYTIGSTTVTQSRNTANHLEMGWASVALTGAFAFDVVGWDPTQDGSGTAVYIAVAHGTTRAVLSTTGTVPFGVVVGTMTDGKAIVNIVQPTPNAANSVPDRASTGS